MVLACEGFAYYVAPCADVCAYVVESFAVDLDVYGRVWWAV